MKIDVNQCKQDSTRSLMRSNFRFAACFDEEIMLGYM
jgi:hypothetical protein